ncbi:hypothetical protein P3T76_001128 [Phytophthora citrophthora]|uniref:Uncharacterized protein n=1 Tax=Phytophthora citrophthora TaxID=4793 RepID=A0AAD9GZU9_9STRA|nr:hypothetical protein P3T76_001128 [Phytophthora citrophthora]
MQFDTRVPDINSTVKTSLNGWYPCSGYTFSDQGSAQGQKYECATFSAPLCYPGICETPQFADPIIDVFVKRNLGKPEDSNECLASARRFWIFVLESHMTALSAELDGAVNIYTMDQRGTGRSTFLDWVAAQATTTGSPAANDVVTFMSKFTNGASTILFGTSYGTVLVERIMHLDPKGVTGYVMDGAATTSGAPGDKFFFMSKRDSDFGDAGDYFMAFCALDADCKRRFKSPNTLHKTVRGVLANFDKNPNSTCTPLIKSVDDERDLRHENPRLLLSKEYRISYFGTDDVYDGVYDEQQPTEATTTTK